MGCLDSSYQQVLPLGLDIANFPATTKAETFCKVSAFVSLVKHPDRTIPRASWVRFRRRRRPCRGRVCCCTRIGLHRSGRPRRPECGAVRVRHRRCLHDRWQRLDGQIALVRRFSRILGGLPLPRDRCNGVGVPKTIVIGTGLLFKARAHCRPRHRRSRPSFTGCEAGLPGIIGQATRSRCRYLRSLLSRRKSSE